MMTSFMYVFHQLLEDGPFPLKLCALQGYFLNYFLFAKFSWLLALSHQLWRGFSSVNRVESEYSFGAYSIFAWGSAAVLIGVPFLIDQIWDGDPNNLQWVSGIGWENCDFKRFGSYLTYIIFVLMVILVALNTTLFILTTISIIRVKLSLRHFSDQDERARNLNSRTQTWLLALSHQLWRGFTSVNRVESEYSFGAYSTFAWGSAAILTGVPFLIDQIWDSDPNKVDWVSHIGWENCDYLVFGNGENDI
ncbi:probable G-protein coupled receptor Mth-like 6 [Drosophila kikkawai]|uniref:Probable G-protein coupled receptor Mth-like 6 n=1 Tax=Drosophila kikkawai TaxID=30033 RepID=A0ABM4GI12_DROKI